MRSASNLTKRYWQPPLCWRPGTLTAAYPQRREPWTANQPALRLRIVIRLQSPLLLGRDPPGRAQHLLNGGPRRRVLLHPVQQLQRLVTGGVNAYLDTGRTQQAKAACSAALTPPDVASQLLMGVPVLALFFLSILLSAGIHRRRRMAEEDGEKKEDGRAGEEGDTS